MYSMKTNRLKISIEYWNICSQNFCNCCFSPNRIVVFFDKDKLSTIAFFGGGTQYISLQKSLPYDWNKTNVVWKYSFTRNPGSERIQRQWNLKKNKKNIVLNFWASYICFWKILVIY